MSTNFECDLPALFAALSDAHRFAIIEQLLTEGECPVGDLARDLPITAPGVTHHLRVLENAGLVERRAVRQQRIVRVRPDALESIDDWLSRYRRFWTHALDRLEQTLKERKEKDRD